jgi:hypothetical protein
MKTMKTTDSHNECPNCGGLPIDPRSVNVDADMLFHNNEPVFTYAGEQQQDWRFQRELDAEPECTNTCFDCGHSWRTPKAKKPLDRDAIYNRAATLGNEDRFASGMTATLSSAATPAPTIPARRSSRLFGATSCGTRPGDECVLDISECVMTPDPAAQC